MTEKIPGMPFRGMPRRVPWWKQVKPLRIHLDRKVSKERAK